MVLTYNACRTGSRRIAAAWRSRGKRFGGVQSVGSDRALTDPQLAFDPAGRAYLSGLQLGDRTGALFTATARGHRFGARRTIAPAPVMDMRLAITGRGTATVGWLADGCGSSAPMGGMPAAAAVIGGRPGPATPAGDRWGNDLNLSAGPGVAEMSWTIVDGGATVLRTAVLSTDGVIHHARARTDSWAAAVADRRGNQIVAQVDGGFEGIVGRDLAVRPAGGTLEPSPVQGSGAYWRSRLVSSSDGAGLGVLAFAGDRLAVAVWRPPGM